MEVISRKQLSILTIT